MPSQSAGDRTSYSTGRVLASESVSNAAERSSPNSVHRSQSGRKAAHAAISMNVAKASFNQIPFHQRIVTRSPNHMWASSWATTSATFWCSLCVLVAGSSSKQALAERDAAEVLHRPGGEIGQGEQIDLRARVRDAVVLLEPAQGERTDLEPESGEAALAGDVDDAQRRAVDVDRLGGLERTDDERHEIRAQRHRVGEPHGDPAVRSIVPRDLRLVGHGQHVRIDDQRDPEHGLQVRLVPARERAAAVGGLHLGRRDDPLDLPVAIRIRGHVRAAVEATELVVEDAGELDGDQDRTRLQRRGRRDDESFGGRLEAPRGVGAVDAAGEDVQVDSVEDQVSGRFLDIGSDVHAPVERPRLEVGGQLDVVPGRDRGARQAVRVERRRSGGGHRADGTGRARDRSRVNADSGH